MRAMDRLECAAFGHTPETALRLGLASSMWSQTVVVAGASAGIMGCATADLVAGVGRPWFLGTDAVMRQRRAWALLGPTIVSDMLSRYRSLENVVACDNLASRGWLRRLGFMEDAETVTVGGVQMVRFWMRRGV